MKRHFLNRIALATVLATIGLPGAAHACDAFYETKPGETLAGIAYKCGTTVSALIANNPELSGRSGLRSGVIVKMPTTASGQVPWSSSYADKPTKLPGSAHVEHVPTQTQVPDNNRKGPYYRISYGDTLGEIAARHGVSIWDIMLINPGIKNPHLLRAGEYIRLPYGSRTVPAPRTKTAVFRGRQTISVVPMPTPKGTVVSVALDGFAPNATVRIGLGPSSRETAIVGGGKTNSRGELVYEFMLPKAFAELERAVVTADTRKKDGGSAVSTPFLLPLSASLVDWKDEVVSLQEETDLPVGSRISIEGVITGEGDRCTAMRGNDGQLYTLTATDARFRTGDVVRIKGIVAPYDWCGQGIAIATASSETRVKPKGDRSSRSDKAKAFEQSESAIEIIRPSRKRNVIRDTWGGTEVVQVHRPFTDLQQQQFVRGIVISKDDRCTTVRGEDGVLYAINAQMHSLRRGDQVELIGHTLARDLCGKGVGFAVEEARRAKYGF